MLSHQKACLDCENQYGAIGLRLAAPGRINELMHLASFASSFIAFRRTKKASAAESFVMTVALLW
jgi:hypothetical protein